MIAMGEADDEKLLQAIEAKNAKDVKAALAAGASASAKKASGLSGLLIALELKSKPIAKQLIAAGADPKVTKKRGETPLHVIADAFPDLEIAAMLIDAGADPNALGGSDNEAPLHLAVMRPKLDLATLLLDKGANIDVHDGDKARTPLQKTIYAATKTSLGAAAFLMERGADVNAVDKYGWNALMYAVKHTGDLAFVQAVAARGARVVSDKYGKTMLHRAVDSTHSKHKDIWEWLLAHGCDVNAQDEGGETAIFRAQSSWNPTAVKFLIAKGTDLSIKNKKGKTVVDEARDLKQTEILAILEAAEKKG